MDGYRGAAPPYWMRAMEHHQQQQPVPPPPPPPQERVFYPLLGQQSRGTSGGGGGAPRSTQHRTGGASTGFGYYLRDQSYYPPPQGHQQHHQHQHQHQQYQEQEDYGNADSGGGYYGYASFLAQQHSSNQQKCRIARYVDMDASSHPPTKKSKGYSTVGKTAAMILNELYPDFKTNFMMNKVPHFECSFTVQGQVFSADGPNKKTAKQHACEQALRELRPDIELDMNVLPEHGEKDMQHATLSMITSFALVKVFNVPAHQLRMVERRAMNLKPGKPMQVLIQALSFYDRTMQVDVDTVDGKPVQGNSRFICRITLDNNSRLHMFFYRGVACSFENVIGFCCVEGQWR
ncbi:unnamed protein product [Gongylonema pulchrum]|uniref:DRBM domain-containing protein n=1 Tax=Gongylonema pulchrum TaxID=637853 RepID=A0A183EAZ6_9BILA|nr:unnamed protein product [Gongylonema pulchrum]